jgi:hypothetical protein
MEQEILPMTKRTLRALVVALCVSATGSVFAAGPAKPKTVLHIVTVMWNPAATPAQIDEAIKGVENMDFPGLKNVWTRPIKMQLPEGYKHIIVMEFESEQALKNYGGSDAQKTWYKLYMPVHAESRTHDVTN